MTASSATSNGSLGSIVRVSPAEWKQPVPLDMFEEQLRTRDLALEYRILRYMTETTEMVSRCERGEEGKDRYRDIIPFKDTRAHVGRAEHDRYINASYIRGGSSASSRDGGFIAAQAPLQSTALDFWSMILHHG
ncbi:phosphatase, non-receptor type, partial [Perkinsus olseni]